MTRSQRFACFLLCLLVAGAAACGPKDPNAATELTDDEVRLVDEALQMIKIRLEMTRDPAAAEAMRAESGVLYTDEDREKLLERLAEDSARGELVMSALHDSLQALREELFPTSNP